MCVCRGQHKEFGAQGRRRWTKTHQYLPHHVPAAASGAGSGEKQDCSGCECSSKHPAAANGNQEAESRQQTRQPAAASRQQSSQQAGGSPHRSHGAPPSLPATQWGRWTCSKGQQMQGQSASSSQQQCKPPRPTQQQWQNGYTAHTWHRGWPAGKSNQPQPGCGHRPLCPCTQSRPNSSFCYCRFIRMRQTYTGCHNY